MGGLCILWAVDDSAGYIGDHGWSIYILGGG